MKSFLSFLSLVVFANISSAAHLSCKDLRAAYQADEMNKGKYECGTSASCLKRQLAQLRQTVKFFTEEDPSDKSLAELKKEYQAYFSLYYVGDVALESANIDLGDNGFELMFEAGTSKSADISISDGTLDVDGAYCKDVEFEAALNSSRKHALCRAIVPVIKKKFSRSEFDHKVCTDDKTHFYVQDFNRRTAEVKVQRNLNDVNGGYFSCSATVKRSSNEVSDLKCTAN